MELIFGLDEQIADYVAHQFPIVMERGGYDPDLAIGIIDDDHKIIGGLVFTDYQENDAELTIYLKPGTQLTRTIIRRFFSIVFFTMKLKRITAKISAENKKSRKFVERLGFKQEGLLRNAFYNGADVHLYGMLYKECPWLVIQNKNKHLKTNPAPAPALHLIPAEKSSPHLKT